MEEIHRGKIMDFGGSWGSGLAVLTIKDSDTKEVRRLTVENAPTVRSLEAAFGEVIGPSHTLNVKAIKGKEIFWGPGEWLDMGWFVPVDEAPPELVDDYEKQKIKLKKELL